MKTFIFSLVIIACAYADTPANCTADDVTGAWVFYEGPISNNPNIECSSVPTVSRKLRLTLSDGGVAVENKWKKGTWTMIYNQGFEVNVNFRTYFAYSKYRSDSRSGEVISFCNETLIGKSHDVTLRHWSCFYGKKLTPVASKVHSDPFREHRLYEVRKPSREEHEAIVDEVNKRQKSWVAEIHEPFVDKTHEELLRLRGGKKSWLAHRVKPAAKNSTLIQGRASTEALDWRDVKGTSYVSPVRDQGSCGSCYAFSSMGMLESRIRLFTNNQQTPILSPQDIVSCTALAQGCSGGFPYLIAGRYAWETGAVEESCNPYSGTDTSCIKERCDRWYSAGNHQYVGGYCGACNEEDMITALRNNGPLSVSFEVYPDFMHYKSGIYHHTGVTGFEPFVVVNHAVLLVGYGQDNQTNEKYWIVKNSWGSGWGDNGYFKIRRGVDECGIESLAVEAFPIPH